MQLNYSIIVPYYNSSRTIKRLLNSVPDRPDLEIIIVDDCSISEESSALDKITSESSRHGIKVIHSKFNKGAGHTRNLALKEASGKWVIFADADDFFTPEFSKILDQYLTEDFDVAYFSATSIMEADGSPSLRHKSIEEKVTNALHGQQKDIDVLKYTFYGPVCKIISRQLIKNHSISFQETHAFNDALFSVKVGYYAKTIRIDDTPIYCITEAPTSVSYTCKPEIIKSRLEAIIAVNSFIKESRIPTSHMPVLTQIVYSRHLGITEMIKIGLYYLGLRFKISKV